MKVLQLCHKPPKPSIDGGCLAMDALTQGLLDQGHEVKILSIHTITPKSIQARFLHPTLMPVSEHPDYKDLLTLHLLFNANETFSLIKVNVFIGYYT